jgi:uncharacterized protein
MKFLPSIITVVFLLTSSLGYCEELTLEKKNAIEEMLEVSGTLEMAMYMASTVSGNLVQNYKKSKPDIDPKAFDIIQEEIIAGFHDEVVTKKSLTPFLYPIYNKYFTLEEINELIRFYKTPIGQKVVSAMPLATQDSMKATQEWGLKIIPPILQRIKDHMKKEGIKLD